MSWHSVHIHYHDDQDELVLDVVRPLVAAWHDVAPGASVRAWFQRHWRLGPHVRINVDAADDMYASVIRPAIGARAAEFLAAHPSTAPAAEQRLAPVHRQLAAEEQERGPLSPWYPDNTVVDADYDDRRHVLGTQEACDLLADFSVATTDLALAMTHDAVRTGHRLSPCLDLMVATAQEFAPQGITQGAMSMRSHAERFLVLSGSAEEVRPRWDATYRRAAGDIERQVTQVLDGLATGNAAPHVRAWLAAVRPVHQRAGELWAAGLLPLPGVMMDPARPFNSPFHNALDYSGFWLTQVKDAPWFQQYRLLLNQLYLHFTRLGVRPVERFWLCHMVACAVEERVGVSAMQRLRMPVPAAPEAGLL